MTSLHPPAHPPTILSLSLPRYLFASVYILILYAYTNPSRLVHPFSRTSTPPAYRKGIYVLYILYVYVCYIYIYIHKYSTYTMCTYILYIPVRYNTSSRYAVRVDNSWKYKSLRKEKQPHLTARTPNTPPPAPLPSDRRPEQRFSLLLKALSH